MKTGNGNYIYVVFGPALVEIGRIRMNSCKMGGITREGLLSCHVWFQITIARIDVWDLCTVKNVVIVLISHLHLNVISNAKPNHKKWLESQEMDKI